MSGSYDDPAMLVVSVTQTRDRLFKDCPEWKSQQTILWVEVMMDIGRWKAQWIRDLLADEWCGRAVQDFSSTTGIGRRAPA